MRAVARYLRNNIVALRVMPIDLPGAICIALGRFRR
jgi:hypothetical protein